MTKPLLFLDVDGPFIPWKFLDDTGKVVKTPKTIKRVEEFTPHRVFSEKDQTYYTVLIHPNHGPELLALAEQFTLIWATTWGEEANRHIGPLLGLPNLPVVDWPGGYGAIKDRERRRGHRGSWKTHTLLRWLDRYAPGMDWAWIDDEVNRFDRAAIATHYEQETSPPRSLLVRVEAHRGLDTQDFAVLADFADSLKAPRD